MYVWELPQIEVITPKRRFTYGLNGDISQMYDNFVTSAVRTSNHSNILMTKRGKITPEMN
jgi:hypothetical protein